MDINQPTSIKEMIQNFTVDNMDIILGIVISEDGAPLEIEIINDPKLILNENTAVIPWHLTDYRTWMSFDNPAIKQKFNIYDRAEAEYLPQAPWAGYEPHPPRPDDVPPPVVDLTSDITYQKKNYRNTRGLQDEQGNVPEFVDLPAFHEVTIYNSLRKDDLLYILSFNHGKKYFVLDRVMDPMLRRREGEEIGDNVRLRMKRIP